ncbi:MAG: HD domain-containing protein [Desulfamplus sp.]|nr:HD domain-containing protein [Desulfamplus sp.]
MNLDYCTCFTTLSEVSRAIHSGKNTREILDAIVCHITDMLEAKGCIYWIVNRESRSIDSMISHGFTYRSLAATDYDTLTAIFDRDMGCEIFIEDARNDPRIPDLERLGKQRVGSVTGMFFDIDGPYTGILAVYFTGSKALDMLEKELVKALGEQGAIALQKALSYDEEMVRLFRQVVESFALALEAKDSVTHGHSLKVAEMARLTAQELGLAHHEVETLFHAGLLHDIGKIGMEDHVLERLGQLSPREMKKAREHPVTGAHIVGALPMFQGIEPLILYHHERFNGSGYPRGIKGEEIPLGARILAVCDVFETMMSGRPNIKKIPLEQALTAIGERSGTLFDPSVATAFLKAVEKHPEVISSAGSQDQYLSRLRRTINDIANTGPVKKIFSALKTPEAYHIGF